MITTVLATVLALATVLLPIMGLTCILALPPEEEDDQ